MADFPDIDLLASRAGAHLIDELRNRNLAIDTEEIYLIKNGAPFRDGTDPSSTASRFSFIQAGISNAGDFGNALSDLTNKVVAMADAIAQYVAGSPDKVPVFIGLSIPSAMLENNDYATAGTAPIRVLRAHEIYDDSYTIRYDLQVDFAVKA